jgi:hypothetical protein
VAGSETDPGEVTLAGLPVELDKGASFGHAKGMPKRSRKKPEAETAPPDPEHTEEPAAEPVPEGQEDKDPAAVSLGRRGGKKGGPARAAKLTKERRSEIAKKAAQARWAKKRA